MPPLDFPLRESRLLSALDDALQRRKWTRDELLAIQGRALRKLIDHALPKCRSIAISMRRPAFVPMTCGAWRPAAGSAGVEGRAAAGRSCFALCQTTPVEARRLASSGFDGCAALDLPRRSVAVAVFGGESAVVSRVVRRPTDRQCLVLCRFFARFDRFRPADLLRTMPWRSAAAGRSVAGRAAIAAARFFAGVLFYVSIDDRGLAIEMDRRRCTYDRLRLLHLTSETLDQRTRRLIGRVFPRATIVETYTSTEVGLVGFRCAAGSWHLAEEGAIFEILDDRREPTNGLGELVVTSLTNWSFPLIRYRAWVDLCRWRETACNCGSHFRAIEHLRGGALIRSCARRRRGVAVCGDECAGRGAGIYQYQVVQRSPDLLKLPSSANARAVWAKRRSARP